MIRLAIFLLTIFSASSAIACREGVENLLVHEYQGQEDMAVGFIQINYGVVKETHSDFYLQKVELNGEVQCDSSVKNQACGQSIALTEGWLLPNDHVHVVMRSMLWPSYPDLIFDRVAEAKNVGTKCRPIWANRK